jgi:hypothetical protein
MEERPSVIFSTNREGKSDGMSEKKLAWRRRQSACEPENFDALGQPCF